MFDRAAIAFNYPLGSSSSNISLGVPVGCANQAASDAAATYSGGSNFTRVRLTYLIPTSAAGKTIVFKVLLLLGPGANAAPEQQTFGTLNFTLGTVADNKQPALPVCGKFAGSARNGTALVGCFCGGKCYSNATWSFVATTTGYPDAAHAQTVVLSADRNSACEASLNFDIAAGNVANGTSTSPILARLGCNATTVFGYCDVAQNSTVMCCGATGCASCNAVFNRCDSCAKGFYRLDDPRGPCVPAEFGLSNGVFSPKLVVPSIVGCDENLTISWTRAVDEQFDHNFAIAVVGVRFVVARWPFLKDV